MTMLRTAIPDELHDAMLAQAEREQISVDTLVSRTLQAAFSQGARLTVAERSARGNWADFDRIMARVPDVPPMPGDER